jgi:hypothetical protein
MYTDEPLNIINTYTLQSGGMLQSHKMLLAAKLFVVNIYTDKHQLFNIQANGHFTYRNEAIFMKHRLKEGFPYTLAAARAMAEAYFADKNALVKREHNFKDVQIGPLFANLIYQAAQW